MYGQIGVVEWGFMPLTYRYYAKYEYENCRSDWLGLKSEEQLKSVVQENHLVLLRIRDRERKIEQLAEQYPEAKLSSGLEVAIDEHGYDSEQAQEYQGAINWQKNADEIKSLQKEYSDLYYSLFSSEFSFSVDMNRKPTEEEMRSYYLKSEKYCSAESALKRAIISAVAKQERRGIWYRNWTKDYHFREDFETFLSDITTASQNFREQLSEEFGQEIRDLVQEYLENPLWHLPQITTFLLVDLLDCDLILLERNFYFGLFDQRISNAIKGPGSIYLSNDFTNVSPLAPKAKEVRRKSRLKYFLIGVSLTSLVLFSTAAAEKIIDLWINQDFPAWMRVIRVILYGIWWGIAGTIAGTFLVHPMENIIKEYINKKRIGYKRISIQAYKLQNIRWDISSGTYDAKTCIERLKKLDKQDLNISSLVYPLLELMKLSSDTSDDKTDASISPD